MSKQTTVTSFFSPSSQPLVCHPTAPAVRSKKRRVGRPRKHPVLPPAPVIPPAIPANPPVNLVVPSSNPSSDLPSDPPFTSTQAVRTRYSLAQKKKVALYARHHGGRAAAKHFKIHHKNVQRWLKMNYTKSSTLTVLNSAIKRVRVESYHTLLK